MNNIFKYYRMAIEFSMRKNWNKGVRSGVRFIAGRA